MLNKSIFNKIQKFLNNFSPKDKVIAVVGPTGSGKTALSIEIAQQFNGEIISADSRQIYRGMDIGTAKTTLTEMAGIPHHLIDICNPDDNYTLADFKKQSEALIQKIIAAGKLPIVIGGTNLYVSALLENYALPKAPPNQQLRTEMEKLAEQEGKQAVHALLHKLDPDAAAKINSANLRYVIRAIEMAKAPAKNIKHDSPYQTLMFAVNWPREDLYQRIEKRVDQMMASGFLDEVKSLIAKYPQDLKAFDTIGYTEIIDYLNGKTSYDEAIKLFKQHSRNYAKRQLTWLKRYKDIEWIQRDK